MLVEFRVKNFRSIRDEQVLSMVASSETGLEDNIHQVGKLKLLKVAGIYGPNASGKSNIIEALIVMTSAVLFSDQEDLVGELSLSLIEPFLLDKRTESQPTEFEITFIHKNIQYQYGFKATSKKVLEEWLYAYPRGQSQEWYHRKWNPQKGLLDIKFGTNLKGGKVGLKQRTKNHVLFLSVANRWNNEQLSTVYEWFKNHFRSILPGEGGVPDVTLKMLAVRDDKEENPHHNVLEAMIRSADFGIQNLSVKKTKIPQEELRAVEAGGLNRLKGQSIVREGGEAFLINVFMQYSYDDAGVMMSLPLNKESLGTQRFFKLVGPWLIVISKGITVFVDELDDSLHPHLSRKLIEFILDPRINLMGGQVIFSAHDTTLLDPELLRRDQIWFTEKDEKGGTRLYSLWDYAEGKKRPRKDEALQRGYLSGRYGAVPFLEAFGIEEFKKA